MLLLSHSQCYGFFFVLFGIRLFAVSGGLFLFTGRLFFFFFGLLLSRFFLPCLFQTLTLFQSL